MAAFASPTSETNSRPPLYGVAANPRRRAQEVAACDRRPLGQCGGGGRVSGGQRLAWARGLVVVIDRHLMYSATAFPSSSPSSLAVFARRLLLRVAIGLPGLSQMMNFHPSAEQLQAHIARAATALAASLSRWAERARGKPASHHSGRLPLAVQSLLPLLQPQPQSGQAWTTKTKVKTKQQHYGRHTGSFFFSPRLPVAAQQSLSTHNFRSGRANVASLPAD